VLNALAGVVAGAIALAAVSLVRGLRPTGPASPG
jgi:hypothetical protein